MASESFIDRWNVRKKIFTILLIINVCVIIATVSLPVVLPDQFKIPELIPCLENVTSDSADINECAKFLPNPAIFVAFGIIVVVNMIGFLAFFNRMSNSLDLTKGEMRKTFAIVIIMLYLLVISLTITGYIDWNKNTNLFENFTYVVIAVIIFYFGSRAWAQAKGNGDNNSTQSDGTSTGNAKEVKAAEVVETNLAVKKAENKTKAAEIKRSAAKDEKERISADAEVKEAKETESKVKKKLVEVTEKAESKKNESRKPEEQIPAAKMELKLEEMNEKLLSAKKSNTIPTIHTTSTLETITSSHQDVQTLMDAVVAEFEQFVAQNPNTSGDVVNDFQQKFTASVGRLISQRNSAIKNAMDNLNPKDLDFPAKKDVLLKQKQHVTDNLAIRTIDRERLNSSLNAIHKGHASNFGSKKIINGIDISTKTLREISRLISEGLIPPMLIGPKSFLMLKQELTSMLQSCGSSTMNNDEQKAFSNLLEQRTQETLTLPDENKRNELLDIIEKIKKKHK